MTAREPLAALVARLLVMGNGECGCPAVASPKFCEHEKAYIEAAMGAVPRLLAAVEAGTRIADTLRWARRFGRVFQHLPDCAVWRGTKCNCGYDAQEMPVDSALALWDSVAE